MKRIVAIIVLCLLGSMAEAASPVYGRGAGSGSDVQGRMLNNDNVYGRQQEATVYRGGQTYDEAVMSTPGLVAYWPLNGTLSDLVSGNTLTGSNTWATGNRQAQAAYYDGVSLNSYTTSSIDLTGTSAVTMVMSWYPNVYDTTNQEMIAEFTTNSATNATGFGLTSLGNTAADAVRVQVFGDGGLNYTDYSNASFLWDTPKWHRLCAVYDKSASAAETSLYLSGALVTATSSTVHDNTNAFGNAVFHLASRAHASLFPNHILEGVALYNRALTAKEIMELAR